MSSEDFSLNLLYLVSTKVYILHTTCLLKNLFLFCLEDRERQKDLSTIRFPSVHSMVGAEPGWSQDPGVQADVSHIDSRDPRIGSSTCDLPGYRLMGTWNWEQNLDLNPGTLIRGYRHPNCCVNHFAIRLCSCSLLYSRLPQPPCFVTFPQYLFRLNLTVLCHCVTYTLFLNLCHYTVVN